MSPVPALSPADLTLAHVRSTLTQQSIERQRISSAETVQAFGLGIIETGSATALYATAVPWAGANTIVHLGLDHPAARADLQKLTTPFRDHRLPFTVILSPLAQPAALPEWLEKEGLVEQAPHWVFDLPLNLSEVEKHTERLPTERLTARQQVDFARIILGEDAPPAELAYVGRPLTPNIFRYGVFFGGQLVAAAQMTVSGRLVHCSGASTLPVFRGRGAQGALLRRRLEDAARAGCDRATVEVSVDNGPSLRNVERAGFRRRYQERHFLWTLPETQKRI